VQSTSEQLEFIEEEKVIVEGHCKGSEESHNRRKYDKANGMRKNQEEIYREKVEIKFCLELLMEML